jgi:hypothetical protein
MKIFKVLIAATAAAFMTGSAYAAQNVANTSQKGSLLVWPLITVESGTSTIIEISNDAAIGVHIECEYVNERKGRVNFDFALSAKKTSSWDVASLAGDGVSPPPFPVNLGIPAFPLGSVRKGELICFATNRARSFQIAWNHLTGTAVVRTGAGSTGSFKYNAWSFAARSDTGLATDNRRVSQGTPGRLDLTGNGAGSYDACPAYNIANFMPNGATLGGFRIDKNQLAVVSCNQDLRESYFIHATKLDFTVWNSFEASFTGAFYCADSVTSVFLSDPPVIAGRNFDFATLKTPNARFEVKGVSATPPCLFRTEASGLLGVLASQGSDVVGNTLHGAGVQSGYVLWDPAGPIGGRPGR